jgi:hypothetical protein
MRNRLRHWILSLAIAVTGGCLLQAGCLRAIQQELEILWAPEANLNLVYDSWLVDAFGPQILKFW